MKKANKARSQAKEVRITEVGLRDGLQNESMILDPSTLVEFSRRLLRAGVQDLEIGAFVSPEWVPQMAGSYEVTSKAVELKKAKDPDFKKARLSVLVPNIKGLERASKTGVDRIAVFAAASESFSKKNINCTIKESLVRYKEVAVQAKAMKMSIRGYLSMCFGCPFEGKVSEVKVVKLAEKLLELGCDEISIGDTIGVADPVQVQRLGRTLKSAIGKKHLAMHFHDTRGTALANILASLEIGIESFDSSLGGLGGCPYAPAATGNVATEDVVYMLHRMGVRTGLDLPELIETNHWIRDKMGKDLSGRVSKAGLPKA